MKGKAEFPFFEVMNEAPRPSWWILPVIVIAQFFCTSLWFAGNAVAGNIAQAYGLGADSLGDLTSAVQFGFIIGTLVFALLSIADRFLPSRVFFLSALLGAGFNLMSIVPFDHFFLLLLVRFMTGFFLAGIYPVGMKIAADHFDRGLGKSLGYLVGALVIGTALPHLLRAGLNDFPWRVIIIGTSLLAALGGIAMLLFVPEGPFRKAGARMQPGQIFQVFKKRSFRSAALGYFGHMWELYTFWAFVPVMLLMLNQQHTTADLNIGFWSFIIIGIGSVSCVIGGILSGRFGERITALTALSLSGICCLLSPLVFAVAPFSLSLLFLLFWGMVVIADSPLFSTLVAQHADNSIKGTALTLVNSIGFALTIVSIQLVNMLYASSESSTVFMLLAVGPVLGVLQYLISER